MDGREFELRQVPFFKPRISEAAVDEVAGVLRSGWLTSGPKAKEFESAFAASLGAQHAIALSSCTAALHLGVEALGLQAGQAVLVPTMTFAATAEVVRYLGAVPVLVDCQADSLNLDFDDARSKIEAARQGLLPCCDKRPLDVVGIMPVHVGGAMIDLSELHAFADQHDLWIVEDAAHAFPAAWRAGADAPWIRAGEDTADVSCFSFYANKTITTGEGGMAVTASSERAERMRLMSLHGLSKDAWLRYAGGPWDYRIVAPGFKYNLTDVAAALGLHQLARHEAMRQQRERVAGLYLEALADSDALELPPVPENRIHAWHLFPIRLHLDRIGLSRNAFVDGLRERGVGFSVHWRPLHLHPYYRDTFSWQPEDLPVASEEWTRRVSLPIYPEMGEDEVAIVVDAIAEVVSRG